MSNKIVINTPEEFSAYYDRCCAEPPKFPISLELKAISEKQARTIPQNNAIYLFFKLLSKALNSAGFDIRNTLKDDFDIPWSPETIKALMWAPVQKVMLGTDSTTKLDTAGVSAVYDVINWNLIDKGKVSVEFPDAETLRRNQLYGDKQ